MTGTPRLTASSIAPVTLPASEQEIKMALAPSLTAWAMRCAWTWPSSAGGVSHTISIGTPCFCGELLAAASAPVRADRKTGLVELFAIIAIRNPAGRALEPLVARACFSPPRQPATSTTTDTTTAEKNFMLSLLVMRSPVLQYGHGPGRTREPPGRKTRVGLVEDDRDDDGAPDDDPFVVLVEVQRADRLSNQHDEQRAERRVDGAALAAGEAGAAHDGRRYHVKLVAGGVDARSRSIEAGAHERREPSRQS